jgi:hypothetical protein
VLCVRTCAGDVTSLCQAGRRRAAAAEARRAGARARIRGSHSASPLHNACLRVGKRLVFRVNAQSRVRNARRCFLVTSVAVAAVVVVSVVVGDSRVFDASELSE